jgi:hypothetical protein
VRTPATLDLHFTLTAKVKTTRGAARVQAAATMVSISEAAADQLRREYPGEALPGHLGFERVLTEHGKARNWAGMLAAAHLAQRQGWAGDWDRWLQRATRQLARVPRETKY